MKPYYVHLKLQWNWTITTSQNYLLYILLHLNIILATENLICRLLKIVPTQEGLIVKTQSFYPTQNSNDFKIELNVLNSFLLKMEGLRIYGAHFYTSWLGNWCQHQLLCILVVMLMLYISSHHLNTYSQLGFNTPQHSSCKSCCFKISSYNQVCPKK